MFQHRVQKSEEWVQRGKNSEKKRRKQKRDITKRKDKMKFWNDSLGTNTHNYRLLTH